MNREIFLTYLVQCLAPTLAPGEIVRMDNLPAHKVAGVRETIEAADAQLWLLPPYSPDLNLIKHRSQNSKHICERPLGADWNCLADLHSGGMQQLLQTRRLRVKLKGFRSSSSCVRAAIMGAC